MLGKEACIDTREEVDSNSISTFVFIPKSLYDPFVSLLSTKVWHNKSWIFAPLWFLFNFSSNRTAAAATAVAAFLSENVIFEEPGKHLVVHA